MEDYHKIAMQCAPLLEGKWRYMQSETSHINNHRAVLQDDEERGRQIIFSEYYQGKGRMQISGSYPNRHYSNLKITVSKSRSVSAIATDINKRFLVDYLTRYDKAKQAFKKHQDKQKDLKIRADLLKKIAPSIKPNQTYSGEVATTYYIERGKIDLSTYNDEARLDVYVSFEQLVKILYLLNKEG